MGRKGLGIELNSEYASCAEEVSAEALLSWADLFWSKGEAAESFSSKQAAGTILSGASKFLDTGVADKWFTPDSAGAAPSLFSPQVTSMPSVFNP